MNPPEYEGSRGSQPLPGSRRKEHGVRHFLVSRQTTEQRSLPRAQRVRAAPGRVQSDPELAVVVPSDGIPPVRGSSRRRTCTQSELPHQGAIGRKDIDAPIAQIQRGQESVIREVHAYDGPHFAGSLPLTGDRPDVCAVRIVVSQGAPICDKETSVRADRECGRSAQQVLRRPVDHANARDLAKDGCAAQGRR